MEVMIAVCGRREAVMSASDGIWLEWEEGGYGDEDGYMRTILSALSGLRLDFRVVQAYQRGGM